MYKDKVVNNIVKNIFLSMCDVKVSDIYLNKGKNKITELREILQRESQNS
jgi:hypothetical protein